MSIFFEDLYKLLDITLIKIIQMEIKTEHINIKKIQLLNIYYKILENLNISPNSIILLKKIVRIKEKLLKNMSESLNKKPKYM